MRQKIWYCCKDFRLNMPADYIWWRPTYYQNITKKCHVNNKWTVQCYSLTSQLILMLNFLWLNISLSWLTRINKCSVLPIALAHLAQLTRVFSQVGRNYSSESWSLSILSVTTHQGAAEREQEICKMFSDKTKKHDQSHWEALLHCSSYQEYSDTYRGNCARLSPVGALNNYLNRIPH